MATNKSANNEYQNIINAEMDAASSAVDKAFPDAPLAYRLTLKSQVTKINGVLHLPVVRLAHETRRDPVGDFALHPWVETVPGATLPLEAALAEIASPTGAPAELARRQFVLNEEHRKFELSREMRAKEQLELDRKEAVAAAARLAAWNALSDEQKALKRLADKAIDQGPPRSFLP